VKIGLKCRKLRKAHIKFRSIASFTDITHRLPPSQPVPASNSHFYNSTSELPIHFLFR